MSGDEVFPKGPMNCPLCASGHTADLGTLLSQDYSGFDTEHAAIVTGGTLFSCHNCSVWFRYPSLDSTGLVEWYKHLPSSRWSYRLPRHYWTIVRDWLDKYAPGHSLLEVGCYRGEFLTWLGSSWQVAAVEPNTEAQAIARSNGISVLGETIFDVVDHFDAIVLFDVLEHIVNPVETLNAIRRCLRPGGIIIVLTGNAQAPTFRIFGRHYWYTAFPEHVIFYTPKALRWLADTASMSIAKGMFMAYDEGTTFSWIEQGLWSAAFAARRSCEAYDFSRKLADRLRSLPKIGTIIKRTDLECSWTAARDHMLVMLAL